MYASHLRAMTARKVGENATAKEMVAEEVAKYPYPSRNESVIYCICENEVSFRILCSLKAAPYVKSLHLSETLEENEFLPGLTDSGVCQVLNGNQIDETFVLGNGGRVDHLREAFGSAANDSTFTPNLIDGTGKYLQHNYAPRPL